jgi:hypothetical protein
MTCPLQTKVAYTAETRGNNVNRKEYQWSTVCSVVRSQKPSLCSLAGSCSFLPVVLVGYADLVRPPCVCVRHALLESP